MLYNATRRELLEGLIVAELISKRGQGPLARRHFPKGERGPASGVRSIGARAKQLAGASVRAATPDALDRGAREPERARVASEPDDTPQRASSAEPGAAPRAGTDAAGEGESALGERAEPPRTPKEPG
jgi:hypothetical protein